MDIKAVSGELEKFDGDVLILVHYEGEKELLPPLARADNLLGGIVQQMVGQGEIKGKLNEMTLIHTMGKMNVPRLLIAGLGKRSDFNVNKIRGIVATALRTLRSKKVSSPGIAPWGVRTSGISPSVSAQAITEGAVLGLYEFRKHMTKDSDNGEIKSLSIVEANQEYIPLLEQGIRIGKITAEAACLARNMVNEPANFMTPTDMAHEAERLAREHKLDFTLLEKDDMRKLGMGGLLGVNQGSAQPPKFMVLKYRGKETDEINIALVGKGLTFDSGGISLKPSENMGEMKGDMSGGASVLSAISAIALLKPKINVIAVVPATENLPSGTAVKPGDVLQNMSGKTIEVVNTDAEGRLILSDAISYVNKMAVQRIVDVATLTGACHIALGDITTGVFSNDQGLADMVLEAGKQAGEYMWQMPMFQEYKELNKSDIADIKNTGGRYGGAITAAQFLAEFVGETPWVHLDIAGTFITDKEKGYQVKGATGVPVRTLINLVLALAE